MSIKRDYRSPSNDNQDNSISVDPTTEYKDTTSEGEEMYDDLMQVENLLDTLEKLNENPQESSEEKIELVETIETIEVVGDVAINSEETYNGFNQIKSKLDYFDAFKEETLRQLEEEKAKMDQFCKQEKAKMEQYCQQEKVKMEQICQQERVKTDRKLNEKEIEKNKEIDECKKKFEAASDIAEAEINRLKRAYEEECALRSRLEQELKDRTSEFKDDLKKIRSIILDQYIKLQKDMTSFTAVFTKYREDDHDFDEVSASVDNESIENLARAAMGQPRDLYNKENDIVLEEILDSEDELENSSISKLLELQKERAKQFDGIVR